MLKLKHEEMRWQSKDGLNLFAQKWDPKGKVKAVICLVHGLGEHSSRYAHWVEKLNKGGYAVLSFDLRGHGRSEGQRGHTPSYDHYADDLDVLLEQAAVLYNGKPCFLYGHSLGGIIVLYYLIQRQPELSGAVVTSAGLHNAIQEQKVKAFLARLLGRIMPKGSLPSGLEQEALSRNSEVVEAYRSDPMVHDRVSFGWGLQSINAVKYITINASRISVPLLLMQGKEDRIAYYTGMEELAGTISGDCTFKLYEGLYHEIHNEPEQEKVFSDLKKWLNSKL